MYSLFSPTQLQLGNILEILTNPLILFLLSMVTFTLVGIIVGVWLTQPRRNRLLNLAPESGRGEELEVASEDTINIYCNAIGNTPNKRFIKRYQGLNIIRKGLLKLQNYALWIGRQGTGYTFMIGTDEKEVKIPLRDAIKNLFGSLYEQIPNNEETGFLKDRIEKSEVAVTVEFPTSEPLTPKNPIYDPNIKDPQDPRSHQYLPSISSDDIRRNDIDTFVGAIVRGVRNMMKGQSTGEWGKIIFILGSGIAIGILIAWFLKISPPIIVTPPAGGGA